MSGSPAPPPPAQKLGFAADQFRGIQFPRSRPCPGVATVTRQGFTLAREEAGHRAKTRGGIRRRVCFVDVAPLRKTQTGTFRSAEIGVLWGPRHDADLKGERAGWHCDRCWHNKRRELSSLKYRIACPNIASIILRKQLMCQWLLRTGSGSAAWSTG